MSTTESSTESMVSNGAHICGVLFVACLLGVSAICQCFLLVVFCCLFCVHYLSMYIGLVVCLPLLGKDTTLISFLDFTSDRGLRLTPRAQAIITQGIGIYAAPLLQPTQITARTAQGNPIYVYHPTAIARLPIPSDTDIIYFTDASGTQQRNPRLVAPPCASPGTRTASTWNTTPGPPSLGRPPTANCAPWQTPSPQHRHPQRSGPATSG